MLRTLRRHLLTAATRHQTSFSFWNRYLFNCGESTDRLFKDMRWSTTNLRSIFLTHLSWSNMGGLASLSLFLQEKGVKYLSVKGPRGADKWLEAAASFLKMYNTTIDIQPCEKSYSDGSCKIDCIPIKNNSVNVFKTTPLDNVWNAKQKMIDFYQHGGRRLSSLPFLKKKPEGPIEWNTSYAYICTFTSQRKLSLSKCVERGVQPGPMLYKLFGGEDVILDDGTVVKATDVLDSPHETICALVIDCPNEGFLDDLVKNENFKPYFSQNSDSVQPPSVIVHFTASSVMKNKRYINWMRCFPTDTLHLVVNDANSPNVIKGAVQKQEYLKLVHPLIHPPLKGVGNPIVEFQKLTESDILKTNYSSSWHKQWKSMPKFLKLVEGRPWTSIDLKQKKISREDELRNEYTLVEEEFKVVPEFQEALKSFCDRSKFLRNEVTTTTSMRGPLITFLGTGSKCSSTIRNSSSILLQLSEDKHMLLDCGEGTLGQLAMLYEAPQLQNILATLNAVYISHLHADHHLGLISILLAHKKAVSTERKKTKPLLLLAPEEITSWLSLYHNTYESILDNVTLIPLRRLELGREGPLSSGYDAQLKEVLDMSLVSTCRVKHCAGAFGVSLMHKNGWKITYSGDTKFCPSLVNIGMDSTLLIHEATFSSHFQRMAVKKFHSTTKDAINIGKLMNAKHVILTHFSQRYEYLPDLEDLNSFGASNVGIAFDFMQVRFQDLPLLPLLKDVYQTVFPDSILHTEKNAEKYRHKSRTEVVGGLFHKS